MEQTAIDAPPRKKRTTANRWKGKVAALSGDVAALEGLVKTLLGHLESALDPYTSNDQRARYRQMIADIRAEIDSK